MTSAGAVAAVVGATTRYRPAGPRERCVRRLALIEPFLVLVVADRRERRTGPDARLPGADGPLRQAAGTTGRKGPAAGVPSTLLGCRRPADSPGPLGSGPLARLRRLRMIPIC
ncbi:hypothetical protein GCM10010495_72380 [Kitasatospora herbaricolor]|nr:hypothetical protein GCM10010495_72380 [Kitasatospora herbaricolor]